MKWRIYYDSGETYSDVDGAITNAPCDGVQVVVQFDPDVGVERLFYKHFYVWSWEHQRWLGLGDQRAPSDGHWGLFDYLRQPGWKKIVAGRTVPYSVFSKVLEKAVQDPDFAVKSAYLPDENR